jgi:hypothetical protein
MTTQDHKATMPHPPVPCSSFTLGAWFPYDEGGASTRGSGVLTKITNIRVIIRKPYYSLAQKNKNILNKVGDR